MKDAARAAGIGQRATGVEEPQVCRGTALSKGIAADRFEYTAKVDGKAVFTATATLSKDGKTITERTKGTNPQGQPFDNVVVFEKQ